MSTPNLGLNLPASGQQNWDVPLNSNFSTIDSVVGGGTPGNVLTSLGPGNSPQYQPLPVQVDNEIPSGAINGTTGSDGNPTFTLQNVPNPSTSLHLNKNGVELYSGTAFTLFGNIITYLAPYIPVTGDSHRATYRH